MTKSELIKQLNKIQNKLADLVQECDDIKDHARQIETMLEEIPDDADAIEDDEE